MILSGFYGAVLVSQALRRASSQGKLFLLLHARNLRASANDPNYASKAFAAARRYLTLSCAYRLQVRAKTGPRNTRYKRTLLLT
jgi:hypothetical protein